MDRGEGTYIKRGHTWRGDTWRGDTRSGKKHGERTNTQRRLQEEETTWEGDYTKRGEGTYIKREHTQRRDYTKGGRRDTERGKGHTETDTNTCIETYTETYTEKKYTLGKDLHEGRTYAHAWPGEDIHTHKEERTYTHKDKYEDRAYPK